MKSALIIFAILTAAAPVAKVERPCECCDGSGFLMSDVWLFWTIVRYEFEQCGKCDGYGKEKTIYGELLKGK